MIGLKQNPGYEVLRKVKEILMTPQERLEALQKRAKDSGVKSWHVSFTEDAHLQPRDKIYSDAADVLEAMLDGKGTPFKFNDSQLLEDGKCGPDCECTCNK
jgi:hypothetical protein